MSLYEFCPLRVAKLFVIKAAVFFVECVVERPKNLRIGHIQLLNRYIGCVL